MKRTSPLHILAKTSGGRTLPLFYGVPEQSTLRDVVDDVKEEGSKVYIYIFFWAGEGVDPDENWWKR